ncbi:hypothetical protein AB2C21_29050, partial [Pseudomonas aeruginosa]
KQLNTWVSFQSAEQPLLGQFSVSGNIGRSHVALPTWLSGARIAVLRRRRQIGRIEFRSVTGAGSNGEHSAADPPFVFRHVEQRQRTLHRELSRAANAATLVFFT